MRNVLKFLEIKSMKSLTESHEGEIGYSFIPNKDFFLLHDLCLWVIVLHHSLLTCYHLYTLHEDITHNRYTYKTHKKNIYILEDYSLYYKLTVQAAEVPDQNWYQTNCARYLSLNTHVRLDPRLNRLS